MCIAMRYFLNPGLKYLALRATNETFFFRTNGASISAINIAYDMQMMVDGKT